MRADRTALLSVRPRYADALLNGSKTVEIRRRRARLAPGSLCLLYASSPVCALVGAIRVHATETASPDAIWSRWGDETGLTRDEFDAYLVGSALPCAIVVGAAVRFARPVALSELRRRQSAFVTPQSYRFLGHGELSSLLDGHVGQLARL